MRKLPEGAEIELEMAKEGAQLALRAGRYSTSLVTLPTDDFPSMTAGQLPHRFQLSGLALRGLIDRTRFAISTEETRYYLNGIYLHSVVGDSGPVLRAVATDGHRLARVEEPMPDGAAGMPGVIIPRKTVAELRKLLDEESGEVEVAPVRHAHPVQGGADHADQQADRRNLPGIRTGHSEGQRQGPARRQERLFRRRGPRGCDQFSERSRPVKMALDRDLLTLSAASPEQGTATEELDGDRVQYSSGPLEIGFQARYLERHHRSNFRPRGVPLLGWIGADRWCAMPATPARCMS